MKAVIKKVHKGVVATTIVKTFTDTPALFQFLKEQGVYISFADATSDLQREEVTYSTPLVNVEVDSEYQ